MNDLLAIVATLIWGVITLSALFRGVAKIRDAGLSGLRIAASILLLIAVLVAANSIAFFLAMAFGYCEHCDDGSIRLRDLALFLLLLIPSLVIWIAIGSGDERGHSRRWG